MSAAEASVLGAVLLSRRALDEVSDMLTPADFADLRHEVIWRAVEHLAQHAIAVDTMTVEDRLRETGDIRNVPVEYLYGLTGTVSTAAAAAYHADVVRRDAMRRRIQEAAVAVVEAARQPGTPEDIAGQVRGIIDAATARGTTEIEPLADMMPGLLASLREPPKYTRTPWRHLNDIMGGWSPGSVYVIGARPGSGKTIMGLQAALDLAAAGEGAVAFSSLEMSREHLIMRALCAKGGIHMTRMFHHRLIPADWDQIDRLRPIIDRLPLSIDERQGVTVGQIRAHALATKRRYGSLRAVVVDYIGLITPDAEVRGRPRHEVVGDISRKLTIMAKELAVPVLVLAQLNRESEAGGALGQRMPTLRDLRESGNIEQDASVVMLLQRMLGEDGKPGDRLAVNVAKNRQGPIDSTELWFEGGFARMGDAPWLEGQQ